MWRVAVVVVVEVQATSHNACTAYAPPPQTHNLHITLHITHVIA